MMSSNKKGKTKMNQATKDIMKLFGMTDPKQALRVQERMGYNGLDFSECTKAQFKAAAKEALRQEFYA